MFFQNEYDGNLFDPETYTGIDAILFDDRNAQVRVCLMNLVMINTNRSHDPLRFSWCSCLRLWEVLLWDVLCFLRRFSVRSWAMQRVYWRNWTCDYTATMMNANQLRPLRRAVEDNLHNS